MNKTERKIYELIKAEYGEYVSVEIFVNCEEISVKTTSPKNLNKRSVSMMNIKGEFVKGDAE